MINQVWLGVGFAGQALFTARFLVQWLQSERAKRSVVPLAFWYLSIAGGGTLLAYAIHRRDPVFIVGQAAGLAVYLRNLRLIAGERRAGRDPRGRENEPGDPARVTRRGAGRGAPPARTFRGPAGRPHGRPRGRTRASGG